MSGSVMMVMGRCDYFDGERRRGGRSMSTPFVTRAGGKERSNQRMWFRKLVHSVIGDIVMGFT